MVGPVRPSPIENGNEQPYLIAQRYNRRSLGEGVVVDTEWVTTSTVLRGLGSQGNQACWDRFVHRFRMPVVEFARRMGFNEAQAEDVAQETLLAFVQAFRAGRYDRDRGRLSQWLFGIAHKTALHQRRLAAKGGLQAPTNAGQTTFFQALPDENALSQSWDQAWEESLLRLCVEQVEQEVEPTTFQAFRLVVLDQHPPQRVADDLNVPIKLVYNAKHRVLKRVREIRGELEAVA